MRNAIILFSLILLISVSQAQPDVANFTLPYLYPGENLSTDVNILNVSVPAGNYSIIIIDNTYTFMLYMSGSSISFVENQTQISSVLEEYALTTTYPTAAELISLNSSFQAFQASRGNEERDCLVVTGLGNPDGSPRLNCTADNLCESCQAVPVCKAVMQGTQTTPDLMSSVLAQSILPMSINFPLINGNTSLFESEMAGIGNTPDMAASLNAMGNSLISINSLVSQFGQDPVDHIYEEDPNNPNAIGFCMDFYHAYNLTALSNAESEANMLSARVPSQSTIASEVTSIINQTEQRESNKTLREEAEAFDAKYEVLLERKSNITEKADYIVQLVQENETPGELAQLDILLSEIRQLGDARNYAQASLLSQNFSRSADAVDLYVSGLVASYNELLSSNSSASDALFEASVYLQPNDLITKDKLDILYTKEASLEFDLYNESPLTLNQITNLTLEFNNITADANSIKDEQISASSVEINSVIEVIANPVVSFSLNILNSFSPLSYEAREKDAPLVISLLLLVADIVALLVVFGAFFFLVRSRRIQLHKVAKILWAFIFVFFIFLLALGSLAIYNVANMQSQPTTFGPFISAFNKSATIGVVADLTDLNGTLRNSVLSCSQNITSEAESLSKNVLYYEFDGDNCISDNITTSISACQNDLGSNPTIILQGGSVVNTTFNVFYTKKAVFSGDEQFFTECPIPKLLH